MDFHGVWRIKQWGYGEGAGELSLYVLTAPAKTVTENAQIDRRSPNRKKGYQRELAAIRLGMGKQGVEGYILNQMGAFPTSVLVNVRKDKWQLKFTKSESVSDKIEIGKLSVPDDAEWFIVDGQHRVEGLKMAMREKEELSEYPVILTMTNEVPLQEMLIFYLVNSRARSVPTDLSYRILQRMLYDRESPKWTEYAIMTGADKRKAVASMIVDFLNAKTMSPFKGRIQEVGEQNKPEHLTTDGTLTRYVTIILGEKIFENMMDEDVADLLVDYWSAIRETYPTAFEDPDDYALVTTLGLSSLSRLFSTVYGYCAKDKDVSKENMKNYLKLLLEETKDHKDVDFRGPISEKWWNFTDGPGIVKAGGEGLYGKIAENFALKLAIAIKQKRKE